jgi:probable ribonuclease FAU-1
VAKRARQSTRQSLVPGSPISVIHAKPWKRTITMRGTVTGWDGGLLTVERAFSAGGQYDSLNLPKLGGDWGTIEVPQGGRVLRRAYYRQDGTPVGELFNVQTPAQIRPGEVRYVDLEVDVVRYPDGRVIVVDEADLAAAVRAGGVTPETAEEALALAHRLAAILRSGGDWRTADAALPDVAVTDA